MTVELVALVATAPYSTAWAKTTPFALMAASVGAEMTALLLLVTLIQDHHRVQFIPALPFTLFMLLALAAGLRFAADMVSAKLSVAAEEHFSVKLAAIPKKPGTDTRTLLGKAPHYLGRSALLVLKSSVPSAAGLAATLGMLYLEPMLALQALLIAALSVPLYSAVAGRGSAAVAGLIRSASAHAVGKLSNYEDLDETEVGVSVRSGSSQFLKSYEKRLVAVSEGHLVSGLLLGALICLLTAHYSRQLVDGTFDAAAAVIFLVLLRQGAGGMRALGAIVTGTGTWSPYLLGALPYLRASSVRPNPTHIVAVTFKSLDDLDPEDLAQRLFGTRNIEHFSPACTADAASIRKDGEAVVLIENKAFKRLTAADRLEIAKHLKRRKVILNCVARPRIIRLPTASAVWVDERPAKKIPAKEYRNLAMEQGR